MGATIEFSISEQIYGTVPNVFDIMLGAAADFTEDTSPLPAERVSSTIGIAGAAVNGAVYLHLPEALAQSVAQTILKSAAGQSVGDPEVNDVVGELCNMIAGAIKSALCDADRICAVSTPSVIRGAFAVEAPAGVCAEIFYFTCLGNRLAVEVHLQVK